MKAKWVFSTVRVLMSTRRSILAFMSQTLEAQIRGEIYRAFEKLNADKRLLATIGSWGDTLDDAEVLDLLKMWNAGQLSEN